MNSKVNPFVAAIVIALVLASIGIWTWGSGAAGELSGPSGIKVGPDGHLFVQVQNQLIEHDGNGQFLRQHDLSRLGVDRLLGAIAFFPDGELLVRRGPDPRNMLDKLRALGRATNTHTIKSQNRQVGLHKCRLQDLECKPFGPETIDFKATFGVFIDPLNGDVYISDTSRHILRKYNVNGVQIAGPITGFRFPNHLTVNAGQLVVADTNHHEIKVLDPADGNFGEVIAAISVTPQDAVDAGHRWPNYVTRVENHWWVNLMTKSMDNGGIYIFDDAWQFVRSVDLPDGADPIAIAMFGDEVLVTDWNNYRVHRISAGGEVLADFSSAGLTKTFAKTHEDRLRIMLITWSAIGILLVISVILVVKGTSPAVSDDSNSIETIRPPETEEFEREIWLEPDPVVATKIRRGMIMAGILIFSIGILLAYVAITVNMDLFTGELILQCLAGILIYLGFAWAAKSNLNTGIGFHRDRITLRNHTGHQSSYALDEAIYDGTMIATPDMAVSLGNEKLAIYDKAQIEEILARRLNAEQKVSIWTMQIALIQMRHPQGILTIVALAGLIGWFTWSVFSASA